MFDIVFISYNEPNADSNWRDLLTRFPSARRLSGVKGIHNAHRTAALLPGTKFFWVVDGDSTIADNFNFESPDGLWEESVYVYKARNPVTDATYGYGGLKLIPRYYASQISDATVDMTTSIAPHFTAVDCVASTTNFNTDPFNTWKSAFRECVKLSSKIINKQIDKETEERLDVWCQLNEDVPYGAYAYIGASQGRTYGSNNSNNIDALSKINDFDWLKEKFNENR
jgi:hypothetical protein